MRYSLCLFALITMLTACRYEDGPLFSLRSAKARICQKWEIKKYIVNGADSLENFTNDYEYCVSYEFYDGDSYSSPVLLAKECNGRPSPYATLTSFWGLRSLGNCIYMSIEAGNTEYHALTEPAIWDIRRLTMDELWINRKFNGKEYEIHFKAL